MSRRPLVRLSSRPARRAPVHAARPASFDTLEGRQLLAITTINNGLNNERTANLPATGLKFSADGRYATYVSNATNLSPIQTTFQQVYRRDFVAGTNQLVSVAPGGTKEANNDAVTADLSANGRYVAYQSTATDIVGGNLDQNLVSDVYWRDMVTNETLLITRTGTAAFGGELIDLSEDGQSILFTSTASGSGFVKGLTDTNNTSDLYLWNRRTGKIQCVSVTPDGTSTGDRTSAGSNLSGTASFSFDGRFVVFPSRAANLVDGVDDGNTFNYDLFVRDIANKTTEYVTVSADSSIGGDALSGYAEISENGRYVIFRSLASDLTLISDTNDTYDVFVRDRQAGTTTLLSKNLAGNASANAETFVPDMTADGRYAVYATLASDISALDTNSNRDIYRVDLTTGVQTLVTVNTTNDGAGALDSLEAKITDDGKFVVFTTYSPNLPGDIDKADGDYLAIYSRNMTTGVNHVLSADRGGNPASADSFGLIIPRDGTRVGFFSDVRTLVDNDLNNFADLFTNPITGHEAAALDIASGKLTVYGSPIEDTINIQRVTSKVVVRRNDERYEYQASAVLSVEVYAGDANDSVLLGNNLDVGAYVSAGSGDDRVTGSGGRDVVQGGPGKDTITGGNGDDRIDGGKGSDQIYGDAGKDVLIGSDGDDLIMGGGSVDRLFDGLGTDSVYGGGGNDRFYAAAGDNASDLLFGNDGTDTLLGRDALDIVDSVEVG